MKTKVKVDSKQTQRVTDSKVIVTLGFYFSWQHKNEFKLYNPPENQSIVLLEAKNYSRSQKRDKHFLELVDLTLVLVKKENNLIPLICQ